MRIDVKIDLKAFWSVSATVLPFPIVPSFKTKDK